MDNKLKSSSEQIEFIVHAIRLTQTLRTSVCNLFSDIGDGLSDPVTSDTFEDASESEHQYHDQRHKAMLNSLRRSLETIGHNFGELDKTSRGLLPMAASANCDFINLDPVLDRGPLYKQINQSYKRLNKMHEHSTLAAHTLSQNALKRSPHQHLAGSGKRVKRPANIANIVGQSQVDNIVMALGRSYPNMNIKITRPLGCCGVVQIVLGRVLRAQVVLRGLVIEWVKVKAFNEDFHTVDGKVDLWSKSKYAVFQKGTHHAMTHMNMNNNKLGTISMCTTMINSPVMIM